MAIYVHTHTYSRLIHFCFLIFVYLLNLHCGFVEEFSRSYNSFVRGSGIKIRAFPRPAHGAYCNTPKARVAAKTLHTVELKVGTPVMHERQSPGPRRAMAETVHQILVQLNVFVNFYIKYM